MGSYKIFVILFAIFITSYVYADDVPNVDKVQQTQQARSDYQTNLAKDRERIQKIINANVLSNSSVNSSVSDSATSKTTGGKVIGKAATTAAVDAKKLVMF